jgi:hypothetical protein
VAYLCICEEAEVYLSLSKAHVGSRGWHWVKTSRMLSSSVLSSKLSASVRCTNAPLNFTCD